MQEGAPKHLWDLIAPGEREQDAEALSEGSTTHRDFEKEEGDMVESTVNADSMNSVLGKLYTREAKKQELETKKYREMYQMLNEKQRTVVDYNRDWCEKAVICRKEGKAITPYHLFLCGPGVTGKSHMVKLIQRDINYYFKDKDTDPEDPLLLLMAFTGTAAFNVDGITLHSALCLPTSRSPGLSDENRSILQQRLKQVKLLVIDEISMVSRKTLDLVHQRMCLAKHLDLNAALFGNISVLVMGDPYQLPPVGGESLFRKHAARNPSELAPPLFEEFLFHELTQIMRQTGNEDFPQVLRSIRVATPAEHSLEDTLLQSREVTVPEDDPAYPTEVMHVHAQNRHVALRNEKMLKRLPGEEFQCKAQDSPKDRSTNLAKLTIPDDPQKTGRLLKFFNFKTGA